MVKYAISFSRQYQQSNLHEKSTLHPSGVCQNPGHPRHPSTSCQGIWTPKTYRSNTVHLRRYLPGCLGSELEPRVSPPFIITMTNLQPLVRITSLWIGVLRFGCITKWCRESDRSLRCEGDQLRRQWWYRLFRFGTNTRWTADEIGILRFRTSGGRFPPPKLRMLMRYWHFSRDRSWHSQKKWMQCKCVENVKLQALFLIVHKIVSF